MSSTSGIALALALALASSAAAPVVARDPPGHLELRLGLENLTDSIVYDQCGLPRPGRTVRLQVRLD